MIRLSVVLATRNEQENIKRCLASVKDLADEIVVVDENSVDKTREIAKAMGARVYLEPHHEIFHITKQKALDYAKGDWILQLDADELVTLELAIEIKNTIRNNNDQLLVKKKQILKKNKLFRKHMEHLNTKGVRIGENTGEIVAFLIPRLNMFLGRPLRHAGVYPDPAIRLVKKGKAFFPSKSVHEMMQVKGEVSWLENYMKHYDSPTFSRYLKRANRYTDLTAKEFYDKKESRSLSNFLFYLLIKPFVTFFNLYLRHLGFLDGVPGFLWSSFSALHFPLAYFKYWSRHV